jgi:hypothetical protein
MKTILSFYMNLLLKLSLSQSILITVLIPEYSVCKVASLVNTFPQAFLEVLHHSLQHGGGNCCHFVPDVLFKVHRCPSSLFVHLALEISLQEVLRLGIPIPINIDVPTKYPLSQRKNRCF